MRLFLTSSAPLQDIKQLAFHLLVHCDPNDEGLTIIAMFTNMDRHNIALPEIWTCVPVLHGKVVALKSAMLHHFVAGLEGTGERYSFILINRKDINYKLERDGYTILENI
ncbi:hypothetical protein PsorP6_009252 [Peronosclerospora sorghi]|uniref:Uncharacterized protein n=1 Tax=Peronosclerospora sorghi TaxID=230839 RepID=A0ACC0W286_9STRA|nr:hypothetical protein PsorP6_009252 [Peronosclerospora sorghi]